MNLTDTERKELQRLMRKASVPKHDISAILPRADKARFRRLVQLATRCVNNGAAPMAAHLMNEALMIVNNHLYGYELVNHCGPKFGTIKDSEGKHHLCHPWPWHPPEGWTPDDPDGSGDTSIDAAI